MKMRSGMLVSAILLFLWYGIVAAQPAGRSGREGSEPAARRPGAPQAEKAGQGSATTSVMLMVALDADRDGELSAEEIAGAEAALKRLDRDGDGNLTPAELHPPLPAQSGGFGQGGPGRPAQARDAGPGRPGGGPAGFGSGLIWLLDAESLHKELKLTEEQSTQFRNIAEKLRQQFRNETPQTPGTDRDQIEKSREQANKRSQEVEKQVTAVLQPAQLQRLKQIELQQQSKFAGPMLLLQPAVAEALQLTEDQRQELADLGSELNKKRNELFQGLRGLSPEARGRKMAQSRGEARITESITEQEERAQKMAQSRGEMEQLADETLQKATALLTPDQKEKLKQVMGEPFELERPGPPAQPRSDRPRPQSRVPAPKGEERTESRRPHRGAEETPPATAPAGVSPPWPGGEGSRLGVGFLIGKGTEELIPLLSHEKDFLEMMLGPEKVRYIAELKPPARAMCISESLEGVARAVKILQEANIDPERVYIAYNPEPRPPGARQCTPREELDDYLGSVKKARALVKDYGAPLIMGPGLIEMAKREELYPEMAQHCDIWMIQTQRLQLDPDTGEPTSAQRYRGEVKRIVELLRQGNPNIQVFVQIIPLQATPERREAFTAERLTSYLLAVEDLVDAAKIYGGNTELIAEVIQRLRKNRPQQPVDSVETAAGTSKRTEMIEMRDGARLATDLYLPATGSRAAEQGGIPVVLVRTPYNKDQEHRGVMHWRDVLLGNGYAFVVQDIRGFYASATGERRGPGQYDGYDTIEWLAQQPWCNGKVGMMGYSHLGAAQYEAAVTQPPHLACAIPAQAPGNYYTDALYPPKLRKADWETILRGPFTSRTSVLLNTRIRRQGESKIDEFNVPMIHSAGWYDFFKEGAIEMFGALRHEGDSGARGTQKLLIGPWGHGVIQEENLGQPLELPGGLAYPANARLDWEKEVWLPWFDHWLKGKPTGVMDSPAVKYYLMGDVDDPQAPGNRWVEADEFPPKSEPTRYYVHSGHTLSTEAPSAENDSLQYEYDPRDPVPTVGRFHARLPVNGPYDQGEVESRADVLVFTTPALAKPLEIVGQVQAKLWASSDRKDTDFTVKLTDVYPDGRSMIFLDGIIKGRYRNGYLDEELLEPGKMVELDIDLGYIAIVLAPGHRLRVAISSSNFDRWDINPNTGEPYGEHALTQSLLAERLRVDSIREEPRYQDSLVATNTVFMDAKRPTHVLLPIPVESAIAPTER